jgi:Protein phosphatase 2C
MPEASDNSASSSSTAVSVRSSSGNGLQNAAQQPADAQPGGLQSAPASDEMDFEASAAVQQQHTSAIGLPFSANAFEHAFTEAFSKVDEEFGKKQDQSQVGTTAVVALVGDRQLYIGNCGACSLYPAADIIEAHFRAFSPHHTAASWCCASETESHFMQSS